MNISRHLTMEETACPCGCGFGMEAGDLSPDIAAAFEEIRRRTGLLRSANVPVRVTSGCRCYEHNSSIGGAAKSRHLEGDALDLLCPAEVSYRKFFEICSLVIGALGGVGWYYPAKNIVHIDLRGEKRRWKQT